MWPPNSERIADRIFPVNAPLSLDSNRSYSEAAIDEGVPAPVITAALYQRFESRDLGLFTGKILSALRSEFGGHAEQK